MMVFFIAFTITFLMIKGLYPLAIKFNLVDHPDIRKHHEGAIPLIGGLAIFLSFLISSMFLEFTIIELFPIFISLTMIVFVGVIDDYKDLSFKIRFLVQALATLLMVIGADVSLNSLGDLISLGSIYLGFFTIPFTIFAVIGSINAFNMMDGIDGLSASLAIIALFSFYIGAEGLYAALILSLIACLSAFLIVNLFAKRKIFMGDAGSMLLGFIIAWLAIYFSQDSIEYKTFSPVTALWVIAIPIMDTVSIMCRRIIKGQSPFMPDREHLHHIFLRAGYSSHQTLIIIVTMAAILAAIGLIADYYHIAEWVMLLSFLIIFTAYFQLIHHSWLFMRWLKTTDKK